MGDDKLNTGYNFGFLLEQFLFKLNLVDAATRAVHGRWVEIRTHRVYLDTGFHRLPCVSDWCLNPLHRCRVLCQQKACGHEFLMMLL